MLSTSWGMPCRTVFKYIGSHHAIVIVITRRRRFVCTQVPCSLPRLADWQEPKLDNRRT